MTLRHKPYGLTHPTWDQPTNFFYDTAEQATAAVRRTYGDDSGHIVVGPCQADQAEEATDGAR